jgi:hypothetical protein
MGSTAANSSRIEARGIHAHLDLHGARHPRDVESFGRPDQKPDVQVDLSRRRFGPHVLEHFLQT